MITIDKGKVEMTGTDAELMADATIILLHMHEHLRRKNGIVSADIQINQVVCNAMHPEYRQAVRWKYEQEEEEEKEE